MRSDAKTPKEYLESLPEDRKLIISKLRNTILNNLPGGFTEIMDYGMLAYVVPLSLYPEGYRSDKKKPLPFINLASQKNYISLYHMGLYEGELLEWFKDSWAKQTTNKLKMGKSCINFKNLEDIPFNLIAELVSKITTEDWIKIYESSKK